MEIHDLSKYYISIYDTNKSTKFIHIKNAYLYEHNLSHTTNFIVRNFKMKYPIPLIIQEDLRVFSKEIKLTFENCLFDKDNAHNNHIKNYNIEFENCICGG